MVSRLKPERFFLRDANDMSGDVERSAVERIMIDIINGVEDIDLTSLADEELRAEVPELKNSSTFFGSPPVDIFTVCSEFRLDLLPYLYSRGVRPSPLRIPTRFPMVTAVAEEKLADAAILHACGYSLFDECGEAYDTFGSYGRFGPDESYFYVGRLGGRKYGDIFDALFFRGQVRGLCYALSTSSKEQLERRDASGKCVFSSSYMFLSLCLSSTAKMK